MILQVREIGDASDDGARWPVPAIEEGGLPFLLEDGDGAPERVKSLPVTGVLEQEVLPGGAKTVNSLRGISGVAYVTDSRLVVVVEKFTKGSTHVGFGVVGVSQTGGVDAQRHVQIARGQRRVELSHGLLRVGVIHTAKLSIDAGDLPRAQPRTAAKQHMFLCVSSSRKSGGRFVRTHEYVVFHRHGRRDGIAYDHHPQAVVERGSGYAGRRGAGQSAARGEQAHPKRSGQG